MSKQRLITFLLAVALAVWLVVMVYFIVSLR